MYACFSNNGGEVTKEKIDVSVHSGQTIMRQMVLLTMFKLKKMKDREFSTKKLAESIKVLRKASGVNVKEFCKSIHMTERSYYSALKSKLTIRIFMLLSCILWWKIMAIAEWTRR